jgi:hypothetical protein
VYRLVGDLEGSCDVGHRPTRLDRIQHLAAKLQRIATPSHAWDAFDDAAGVEPVELDADLPMGVDPEAVYKVQRLTLEPGDRLVLVSAGVFDAAPDGGLAYGAGRA